MAMGRRNRERQGELWIATQDVPQSTGHPFYEKLNQLLGEAEFDEYVESLCEPFYAAHRGRPGIPPGVYFRMLLTGYFEGIDSQRGIAWRCADSLSLKSFLGYSLAEATPDHSSLTVIRQRLSVEIHEQVFTFVLKIAQVKKLLKGKAVAVDATLLEANAAMKSIVRRDTGEGWKEYLRRLMAEEGIEDPTDEELRRFDKKRKGKKVSNKEWVSPTDPEARIMKMKDGRTHMAYKSEHAIDLESGLLLAATIHHGDRADSESLIESLVTAQANLIGAGSEAEIRTVPADKGYHKTETLAWCRSFGIRTYIPERESKTKRQWADKPAEWQEAYYGNRRRVRGRRGKRLQRLRSEHVERSFAHVCETGGARRSWLSGVVDVGKRYLMYAAGHNLGVVMRKLFGVGTPRTLQAEGEADSAAFLPSIRLLRRLIRACKRVVAIMAETSAIDVAEAQRWHMAGAPALAA
jgi:transposase